MKKEKKKYAKCPCCNSHKHRTEMKKVVSKMVALEKMQFKNYEELKLDSYESFIDADFEWACDECYSLKKAIEANPAAQNYCWSPYMSYFDSHFTCSSCKTDFIFSKDEKKHWFEKLKFWIDSSPVNCVDCRKEIRQLKIENKTLSLILKNPESKLKSDDLTRVIEIYSKWGKTDKANYFRSLLNKYS